MQQACDHAFFNFLGLRRADKTATGSLGTGVDYNQTTKRHAIHDKKERRMHKFLLNFRSNLATRLKSRK